MMFSESSSFCLSRNPEEVSNPRRVEICLSKISIADSDSLKQSDRSSNDEPRLVFCRDQGGFLTRQLISLIEDRRIQPKYPNSISLKWKYEQI